MSIDLKSISERNREDLCTGESLGIAATRYDDRKLAVKGQLEKTPVEFEPSEGVEFGGALFLLPSLLSIGLLSYQKHYSPLSGYYDLGAIILTLAFF